MTHFFLIPRDIHSFENLITITQTQKPILKFTDDQRDNLQEIDKIHFTDDYYIIDENDTMNEQDIFFNTYFKLHYLLC